MNRRSLFRFAGWGLAAVAAPAVTTAATLMPVRQDIDGEEFNSPLVVKGNGVTISNCVFHSHPEQGYYKGRRRPI